MLQVTNKTNAKVLQPGTMWVEMLVSNEDINILTYNKIWFEKI
jgi:hypothetical protein